MITNSNKKLINYLSEIESQSSKVMLDGYFHINAVIEAFTKGEESGSEKVLEHLKEQFMRASTQMFLYGGDFLRDMEKRKMENLGFYINPFAFKFMVITSIENTYDENFIDTFYSLSEIYEEKFKNEFSLDMRILFIPNENLNQDALEVDGFIKISNGEA